MNANILPKTDWKKVFYRNAQLKCLFEYTIPAHKMRNEPLCHLIFETDSEDVKRNLIGQISEAMNVDCKEFFFDKNTKQGELSAFLTSLGDGDILFFNGINNLKPAMVEIMKQALESFVLNIQFGTGPLTKEISIPLAHFTMLLFFDNILEIPEMMKRYVSEIIRIKEISDDELVEFALCDDAEKYGVLITEENLPFLRDMAKKTSNRMALNLVQKYLFLHPEISQPISKETLLRIL